VAFVGSQATKAAQLLKLRAADLFVPHDADRDPSVAPLDLTSQQPGAIDVVSRMEARLAAGTDEVSYFAVGSRNGTVRAVCPSNRPLEYYQQLVANDMGISLLNEKIDSIALESIVAL
jgi:hypothetical protein